MTTTDNILIDKPVIFDWDGTIVASVHGKAECMKIALQKYQIDERILSRSILNKSGIRRDIKIKQILMECIGLKINESELSEILIEYSLLLNTATLNFNLIPGIAKFINNRTAVSIICSSAPQKEIEVNLSKISTCGNSVIIFPEVRNKIEQIKIIKTRFEDVAYMFGDSIEDYNSAKFNNLDFIGVCYDNPELKNRNDIKLIKTYNDLRY